MDYQAFERLLAANKTTVYRVAKETGISNSSFSDWKRGRSSPKADKLQKLADYFGASAHDLPHGGACREHGTRYRGDTRRKPYHNRTNADGA